MHLVQFCDGVLERDAAVRRMQVQYADFLALQCFQGGEEGRSKGLRGMVARFDGVHPDLRFSL